MNKKQLMRLGVPADCVNVCVETIRNGRLTKILKKNQVKRNIAEILTSPSQFTDNAIWSSFAYSLIQYQKDISTVREPISFKQWGNDIDDASKSQMRTACELPIAVSAAMMPDAHVGYGLPIGGVLATDNHVIPYAVGVDISCRMRLTIVDMPIETLQSKFEKFKLSLEKGTLFGTGKSWRDKKGHDVMDQDWAVTPLTANLKDRAWSQLGTSGSGNHFVEFGTIDLPQDNLGLSKGKYVALLSHSGSRNAGANVCKYYTHLAQKLLPKRYLEKFKFLAWLSLDTQEGQEYWAAMNLMGDYAAANHAVIHRDVVRLLGAEPITVVENNHNFAWKEKINGKELIVHRKGATPAGEGVLGIIPGSMGDPGFVVKGKGNIDSLLSASHGAGRRMSRKAAKEKFNPSEWRKELKNRGVRLLSGGLDEMPGAYKNILDVMLSQQDLVETVARFDPKIVKMCDDGSLPED